ncbi:MAG: GNAT family N-acetyltransferase [Gammaproteobacteria bacterium]|nr:GNAT family N-acetyltransferase [Gammaproteobacteria bacterium]
MTDQFHIRPARAEDIIAIQEIYALEVLHGTASFETEAPNVDEMTRRWQNAVDGGFPYLVALSENRIAGYAYAGKYRTRPAYRFSVEDSVYVAQWARRKGLARQLLLKLIDECKQRGFKQIIAIIGDSTHTASIELHKSLGFRLVGTLENVGWKHKRWLDSVLMQLSLGSG